MHLEKAQTVTLNRGEVLGDDATATSVRFLDTLPLFDANETEIYVRFVSTVLVYLAPVVASGEALGIGEMDLFVANLPEHFVVRRSAPVLAYLADEEDGKVRVRRASPR